MEGIFPGIFPHLFCLLFLLMFRLVTHAAAVEQTTTVILGGNEFIFKELDLSRSPYVVRFNPARSACEKY